MVLELKIVFWGFFYYFLVIFKVQVLKKLNIDNLVDKHMLASSWH